ncbi:MAG: hypothetical protein MUF34_08260 [Polyangiaceae bacterium]|nr:hypothetical protein [Polyangiaceae bacterium]
MRAKSGAVARRGGARPARSAFGRASCAAALTLASAREARAWVLPEHTQITAHALASMRHDGRMTPAMGEALERVRVVLDLADHDGVRVEPGCRRGAPDLPGGGRAHCPSLAYLPALAGDHSCRPAQLEAFLLEPTSRRWLEDVVRVGDITWNELAHATSDEARAQTRRGMHVDLQRADEDYVARAAVDYAHFELAREAGPLTLSNYLALAFAPAQQANATAAYANYHTAALRLADEARRAVGAARDARLVRALLAEAFALHFLEDSFAAGHFTGHWGSDSARVGTHDYYSGFGAEATTWATLDRRALADALGLAPAGGAPPDVPYSPPRPGAAALTAAPPPALTAAAPATASKPAPLAAWAAAGPGEARFGAAPYRARGDAFLGDVDLRRTSAAVAKSLTQVLRAATEAEAARALLEPLEGALGAEAYDACTSVSVPPGLQHLVEARPLRHVLADLPVPAPREPAPPRARVEKGAFVGVAGAFEGAFDDPRSTRRRATSDAFSGRLRVTGRFGLGVAGLVEDPMNAQSFVDVGFVGASLGAFTGARQSVSGWTVRVRAPGKFLFLDGLVAVGLAQATRSPGSLRWAADAANGGLGHWWRSRRLVGPVTGQLSVFRDVMFSTFTNEPGEGQYRRELAGPLFSARYAFPMTGVSPGQSIDLWFDLGGTMTWSSQHPSATAGAYASFSMASRVFPSGWLD